MNIPTHETFMDQDSGTHAWLSSGERSIPLLTWDKTVPWRAKPVPGKRFNSLDPGFRKRNVTMSIMPVPSINVSDLGQLDVKLKEGAQRWHRDQSG
jgi:hypothetical protein